MYRQILIPDEKNHSIEMPEEFFGKKVEVIVIELGVENSTGHPLPPRGKKVSKNELFETFGADSNFPSINEIRNKAWSSKW